MFRIIRVAYLCSGNKSGLPLKLITEAICIYLQRQSRYRLTYSSEYNGEAERLNPLVCKLLGVSKFSH